MVSEEVMGFFPHDVLRESQDELVSDFEQVAESGKILLAHAPTGLGKTASALCVALAFAQKHKKKVLFLTNRHTQHKIAVETLEMIGKKRDEKIACVDLIGKRWMCQQDVASVYGNDFNEFCKTIVERGECEYYNNVRTKKGVSIPAKKLVSDLLKQGAVSNEDVKSISGEHTMCSYEVALLMAKDADVIIGDYYYIFNPFVQATLFNKIELDMEDVILIVDEGHNLPSRVTDMLSHNLSTAMISNAILEAKKYNYKGLIGWLEGMGRQLQEMGVFDRDREILVSRDEFLNRVKKLCDFDTLLNELELAAEEIRKKQRKSSIGGIATFLEAWNEKEEGFARILGEKRISGQTSLVLSYSCLDPSIVTKDVFDKVHSGIVMSGTLTPTFMYKDVLGIKEAVQKEYPCPFPIENRLSLIVPETSTKYTLRSPAMYEKMGKIVGELCKKIRGNVAVFFPSYEMRDRVADYVSIGKEIVWEKPAMSKAEKETILNRFRSLRLLGGVLLGVTGANFAEGIDFPGDLLKGVVIVGLPLARPSLKTKEIIKYYDNLYGRGWDYGYIFPAMNKCLQSAGRCIRTKTDRGVVVYLDERFAWQKYYSCLSREGLIVSKEYSKHIDGFFEN